MAKREISKRGKTKAIFITEDNDDIDVLGRKEFINQILQVIEYYSEKKQTISFSIQGDWGIGKSWLIKKLYNELYDFQDFDNCGSKYCIFIYNAWDFDYYDEPLISLFISIYKQLNNENALFIQSEETREKVKALFETLKDCFLEELKPIPLIGNIINFKKEYDETIENLHDKIRKYDYHFDLNQIMEATIKGLAKIAEQKQLVIIVDELDRCLPEYTIKVLERMHHITQSVKNLQIIYSIDKNQIEETVRKIYGREVNSRDYLKKFYSFGFNLYSGFLNEKFIKKYEKLFNNFDFVFTDNFDKEKAFISILSEINMRERENIIQKIELINSILNKNNETWDISILYVELFITFCMTKEINIFKGSIGIEKGTLSFFVENDTPQFIESSYVTKFFDGLANSHNVKHVLHEYDGYYEAGVEYVVYNLLNNYIRQEIPEYYVVPEIKFYKTSYDLLNNFTKIYRSIEM